MKIKLHSLLYNHDFNALEELKTKRIDIYNDMNKPIETGIVNTIDVKIDKQDNVEFLKHAITNLLIDKLKIGKKNNTCFYCFNNKGGDKENEIINVKKSVKKFSLKKIKLDDDEDFLDEEKEDDIDLDDIDLDDIDLDDIELDEDDEDFNLDDIMQNGGSRGSNIMVCHNCKKVYFFNKYIDIFKVDKYDDIYPIPELFYLWNDKGEKYTFTMKDNFNKEIEYKIIEDNLINPLENLQKINKKYLISDKKEKLSKYIRLVSLNDNKQHRYIHNTKHITIDAFDNTNVNMVYMPELFLYNQKNITKCLDLYSKIYFPFIDYYNYFGKFYIKNQKDLDNYIFCISRRNKKLDLGKYSLEEALQNGDKYRLYTTIKKLFIDLKELDLNKYFNNKVFYKVNDNDTFSNIINFYNIMHLFEVDEEIPYISTYLVEESKVLTKIYKPLEEYVNKQKWSLSNKRLIQFKVKYPETIYKKNQYFQVNLYENMKMEITASFPTSDMKTITEKNIEEINNVVNKLIQKLNKYNIFIHDNVIIPKSNPIFKDWKNEDSNTKMNSMNFFLKYETKLTETQIVDIMNKLNNCMKIYYSKEYDLYNNNFRYNRINNNEMSNNTDKFIYQMYNNIIQDLNIDDEKIIKERLIESLMISYNKSYEESLSLYENYRGRYRSFDYKPINFGIFFSMYEIDEWKNFESKTHNFKIDIKGIRTFDGYKNIKTFISKLLFLFENYNNKSSKQVQDIIKNCELKKIEIKEKNIVSEDKYVALQKEKLKCYYDLKNLEEQIKNKKINRDVATKQKKGVNKRLKYLGKEIDTRKKEIKKFSSDNLVSYISRLQEVYPNLKLQCDKCGIHGKEGSKNCQICNEKLSSSSYSKNCQKKRQPMGTGEGIAPSIVDFNEEIERKKLDEDKNITCKIDQVGGANDDEDEEKTVEEFTSEQYENWGIKNEPRYYKKKLNINHCQNTMNNEDQGYKIQHLRQVAKLYKINNVEKKKKQELCIDILTKIKNSKKLKEQETKTDGDKNKVRYLKKYNELIKIHEKKTFEEKLMTAKNIFNLTDSVSNKTVLITLIKIIRNKDYDKENYLQLFNLTELDTLIKEIYPEQKANEIIKNILIYNVYNFSDKWKVDSLKEFYHYFFNKHTILKSKKSIKSITDNNIEILRKKYLTTLVDFDKEIEQMKEDTEYRFKNLVEDAKILYNQDENGNIIRTVMSYKGKSLTCPNYNDVNNNSMIGFLDFNYDNLGGLTDKEIRDNVCQPCCFSSKKDSNNNPNLKSNFVRNMLFCKAKISWKEYLKREEEEQRVDNYISTNIRPNKPTTYGKLPTLLHSLFNSYDNLYSIRNKEMIQMNLFTNFKNNILKTNGFVAKGIKREKNKLIDILSTITDTSFEEIVSNVKKLLKNEKIFMSLNMGKIFIKFKTPENFIKYIETIDTNDYTWLVDILSREKILNGYDKGINIILLSESDDVVFEKFEHINQKDYYDNDKTNIYLYKYTNEEIEPIVLKTEKRNKDYANIVNVNDKLISNEFKKLMKDFDNFILKWISSSYDKNYITSKQMLEIQDGGKQIIDIFKNVNYIYKDNKLYPVFQSGIDVNGDIEIFTNNKDLDKYKNTLTDTIKYINEFSKKYEEYEFKSVITDEKNKKILGIELNNRLIIATKEEDYNRKYFISKQKIIYDLNKIIFDKILPKEDDDFVKEKYDTESYNHLVFELSKYINSNKLNEKIEKTEDIKKTLYEILDKITKIKEVETINYDDKTTNNKNIRKSCAVDNEQNFCEDNKVLISLDKKNIFYGLIYETFVNKTEVYEKIMNNKIHNIINRLKFIDGEKHIFKKETSLI
jgi:hypothetical protein